MTKKIMKMGWVLLAALGLFQARYASAAALQLNLKGFSVPVSDNGQASEVLDMYGVAVSTWDGVTVTSNTAGAENVTKQWTNEAGILYDIELASGTATSEYVFCVDVDQANGAPNLASGPTAATYNVLIICHRSATLSKTCHSTAGKIMPRYFRSGLACYSDVDRPYIPLFRELR